MEDKNVRLLFKKASYYNSVVNTPFELAIKLVQLIFLIALLVVFYRRKQTFYSETMTLAFYIVLMAIMHIIFSIILYLWKITALEYDSFRFFKYDGLQLIPLSFTLLLLYLMTESLISEIPPYHHSLPIVISWSSFTSVLIYQIIIQKGLVFQSEITDNQPFNLLFKVYEIIILLVSSDVYYQSYKNANYKAYKDPSQIMLFCIGFLSVAELVFFILKLAGITYFFEGVVILPVVVGILYVYVKYPHYIITVPLDIKHLVLTTEDGIELFSMDASIENFSNPLLASGMSAFNTFMGDALGSVSSIKYLMTTDTSVLVSKNAQILGFVVTSTPSRIMKKALDGFVREYKRLFVSDDLTLVFQYHDTSDLKPLIYKYFPFLEFQEMINPEIEN